MLCFHCSVGFGLSLVWCSKMCSFLGKWYFFAYLWGLIPHWEALLPPGVGWQATLHNTVGVFLCVFSWSEIFISWISHTIRPPKKLSNMFHNKRVVPGSNEGQLNRGVRTLTQQRVAVSIVTLSVCRLLKLTREQSAQSDHLCTCFGSCLITALERGVQTRLERTWSYKAELMKTFGNWSSAVMWLH